jgi:hypothetical protein
MRLEVGLLRCGLGGIVRPTRIGGNQPLLSFGLGIDPGTVTTDPPAPTDRADPDNGGQAFVPFLNPGLGEVVQYKTGVASGGGSPVTVTLDDAPTIGNILVLCAVVNDDSGPVLTIGNGTWVQAGSTVYSGNGTNWPNRLYYQTVTAGTVAATTVDSTGGATDTGKLKVGIIELNGVDSLDSVSDTQTNTSTTTATLTPTASMLAIIISATARRTVGTNVLTPAAGMTEWAEIGDSPYGLNYRVIDPTSGGYTVGSTGASANSSMVAAAFTDTGVNVNWIDAPLSVDGSGTSYEYADSDSVDAAGLAIWRGTLADSYLIASMHADIGFETAGSVTITVQGANEADYSDAVTVDTVTLTATGSYTSDDVDAAWIPTAVYQYWQLLIDAADGVHIFEVTLLDPADPGEAIDDHILDPTDAHDASAISVVDAGGYFAGTDVEAVLQELGAGFGINEPVEVVTSAGATETIDYDTAHFWDITLTANCVLSITNPPPDQTWGQLVIILRQSATAPDTVTWPASVEWPDTDGTPGGAAPTLFTVDGAVDVVTLVTVDGGVTWGGSHGTGGGGTPATTVESETTFGISPAVGTDTEYARQDHTHGSPDNPVTVAAISALGYHGGILLDSAHATPFTFGEILQESDGSDFLYASEP